MKGPRRVRYIVPLMRSGQGWHLVSEVAYRILQFFLGWPRRLHSRRGRSILGAVWLLVAAVFLLRFSDEFYPIKHWLFVKYLQVWLSVGLFMLSSLVGGWWVLAQVTATPPRLSSRLVWAMSVGVLTFYSLMFLLGIAQLYSPATFYCVPLILLGIGAPRFLRDLERLGRRLRALGLRPFGPRTSVELLASVLVVVALAAIYMQVLLPRNSHADTHWYHMPIAEYYVAAGGIVKFPEGWYVGVYPQLASILYTWAFQGPGDLFTHVSLCLHLDFALFLVTVVGVPVLSAKLLGVRRFPAASAALFLFPSLFVYDSNINASADHILGFWSIPLGLALLRLSKDFSIRSAILTGLLLAAPAVTKYQGSFFVIPTAMFLFGLAIRQRRWRPLLICIAVAAFVTSSHWLKNLIFYHDPLYPLLNEHLPSSPFHDGAATSIRHAYWDSRWITSGPWSHRLWEAGKVLLTFSFVPNDFDWHGQRPTFGSLFTLLLPALLIVRAPRRLWLLVIATHLGIVVWYLTSHQDRYLQALLPWMAVTVATTLALLSRLGRLARAFSGLLVAVQIVLGLDVYFIRKHNMLGDSPIRVVSELLAKGHQGKYAERLEVEGTFEKMRKALGDDTVLLQHYVMARLGIGVRVVADGVGWQGAIEYLHHDSPMVTAELMQRLGVNAVARYGNPDGLDPTNAARELVFHRWLQVFGGADQHIDDASITRLLPKPKDATLAAEATRIAWLDCRGPLPRGLYTPRGLNLGLPTLRFTEEQLRAAPIQTLRDANGLVIRQTCPTLWDASWDVFGDFERRATSEDVAIWVRIRRNAADTSTRRPEHLQVPIP